MPHIRYLPDSRFMIDLLQAWLLDPLALLFLLSLFLGLSVMLARCRRASARRSRRSSCRWHAFGLLLWTALFLICSAPVIVNPLIAAMEDPWLGEECDAGSHLVLLGGGVDSRVAHVEEFGRMSNATLTRTTQALHRLLAEPDLTVIVAGGAVGQVAEADLMSAYLQRMGVAERRIVREAVSGNTRENALHVARKLENEAVRGPVRLLSSAMHMPRAFATFRSVFSDSGLSVCPVSVDVQALRNVPWYAVMPQTTAIVRFEMLMHEAVALLIYRLRGWL